jgi:hypothetical protein
MEQVLEKSVQAGQQGDGPKNWRGLGKAPNL